MLSLFIVLRQLDGTRGSSKARLCHLCDGLHRPHRLDEMLGTGQCNRMHIYKILRTSEWTELLEKGATDGAPVDKADGFIHFSTGGQVAETAAKHFSGEDGLIVAAFESEALGDALKWETSRNNELFPHLYGPLRAADVVWHAPLPLRDGKHDFAGLRA